MKNNRYIPPTNPNTDKIIGMRRIGYTFEEIGSTFRITKQRASAIWEKYKKDHIVYES